MSFQLVIAEKPSVARSIAAVIGATEKQNGYWQGGGYLVSWCICTVQFWFSFTRIGRCFDLYKSYYHRFTTINFAKSS